MSKNPAWTRKKHMNSAAKNIDFTRQNMFGFYWQKLRFENGDLRRQNGDIIVYCSNQPNSTFDWPNGALT